MDVDTARMRAFVQVVERGTVAAAATALGYTAPAVSQQIGRLEAQLGTPLFDRVGGRLRLSPSGERLLPTAKALLDLTEEVERAAVPSPAHRDVVIAGFASALSALVLPLLDSPLARTVSFDVREAEDAEALRDLGLGHADIVLTQEYGGAPVAHPSRFTWTPVLTDRLRLVAPPSWPPSVNLDELAQAGWLVNGTGTRCEAATQAVLHAAGINVGDDVSQMGPERGAAITGRIADNHTLLDLVAAGHGATIVPELVLHGDCPDVTVASADLGTHRTILAVTRTTAAHHLADIVKHLGTVGRRYQSTRARRSQRDGG